MKPLEQLLRKVFPHEEIGWKDISEEFTRFTLLRTPWFRIYLHKLNAPTAHPQCHDHPWSFITFLLAGGYWEDSSDGKGWQWRRPGLVLCRSAEFRHNVVTEGVSWSLVVTGPKRRKWGLMNCR